MIKYTKDETEKLREVSEELEKMEKNKSQDKTRRKMPTY